MSFLKNLAKKILSPGMLVFLVIAKNKLTRNSKTGSSFLDEDNIIKKYLDGLNLTNKYCVDIAASDGISSSNTYSLYKEGWAGIAVEFDPTRFSMMSIAYRRFPDVSLVKTKVFPDNVLSILKSCNCPKDFAFLNLDIDGYDYFVLDNLLNEYRPGLICAEINENIPPPIKFTVRFDVDHFWNGDHFHGQSIAKCFELCEKYNYEIVELHYNNVFLIPKELNKLEALTPEKAYEVGYKNKTDRKKKFFWNSDMEEILTMDKEVAIQFLNKKFVKYAGKFIVE